MLMNISVCVDPTMININPNTLVICIGDCGGNPQLMERLNAIPASLYNPPFEAITANIDGDYNTFQQLYFQYLVTNSDVSEFTIAMIRSLIMGKEIVLYLDRNEYDLYFNVLSNYFTSSYSLLIGNPYTGIQGGINDNMLQDIVSYLYLTNEMPADIFIRLYNKPFNQDVINKLLVDFNMTNKLEQLNCNLEQYNRIFNDIKYDIVSNRTSRRPKIYRNY